MWDEVEELCVETAEWGDAIGALMTGQLVIILDDIADQVEEAFYFDDVCPCFVDTVEVPADFPLPDEYGPRVIYAFVHEDKIITTTNRDMAEDWLDGTL